MSNNLKIISYNLYFRPRFSFWDNQVVRAKLLAQNICEWEETNGKIDVLLLQEVFDHKANKIIKKDLKNLGFIFKSHRVKKVLRLNGGGLIYSRHPICELDNYTFKKAQIFTAATARGVNYAKILKDDTYFHLFNVHYDSFNAEMRKIQMTNVKKFIDDKNIPEDESIIMGGDYNIDMYKDEINNVDEVFDYEFPDLKEEKFTQYTIHKDNDWIARRITSKDDPDNKAELLDFFIFDSEDIDETEMKVVKFKHDQKANGMIYSSPFFLNILKPWKSLKVEDLSDHYAVCCDFKY